MADFTERAARMRVLWNRGRHIYSTFYTELNDQRREQGDEALADWCFHELRISLSICNAVAGILKKADATVVQRDLAEAVRIEKAAAAQQRAEQAARNRRERETAHARRQAAAAEAEMLRVKTEAERQAETKEAKRLQKNAKQRLLHEATRPHRLAAMTQRKAALKAKMLESGPENRDLVRLIAECNEIKKLTRIELGRRYAMMKEIVETKRAGKNWQSNYWTWRGWVAAYLPERSYRDVDRCIAEYVGHECPTPQSENVFQFPQNIASIQ